MICKRKTFPPIMCLLATSNCSYSVACICAKVVSLLAKWIQNII